MKILEKVMIFKKISVDFHGVIYLAPEFFKQFMQNAIEQGIEVQVVSGGPRRFIADFLAENKIPYHKLWCIIDQPEINEKTVFFADGSFRVDDDLWDKAKGEYCFREHIDLHIDDSDIYEKYFTTPYCRFIAAEGVFIYRNQRIFSNLTPQEVLEKLQKLNLMES